MRICLMKVDLPDSPVPVVDTLNAKKEKKPDEMETRKKNTKQQQSIRIAEPFKIHKNEYLWGGDKETGAVDLEWFQRMTRSY